MAQRSADIAKAPIEDAVSKVGTAAVLVGEAGDMIRQVVEEAAAAAQSLQSEAAEPAAVVAGFQLEETVTRARRRLARA